MDQIPRPTKVFLSSTYEDLAAYREHVMWVLDGCELVYKGMEFFGASQTTPLETCLGHVEGADLVVAIIGTRYGSSPPGNHLSYTELEIDRAFSSRKPIWAYVIADDALVRKQHVETGEAAERIERLNAKLRDKLTVERFTSPEDLGMKIARDFFRNARLVSRQPAGDRSLATRYRECAYDALAEWYDYWYEGHWSGDQPFQTISSIAGSYFEASRGQFKGMRVLDVACGSGNTFVAFSRAGFQVWGADGSREMLRKATANCTTAGIPTERLVREPINWTDLDRYHEEFEPASFDVIINTANSMCHVPPLPEYLHRALRNYHELLKPGGLLMIDTKRYMRSDPLNRVPLFRELRYDGEAKDWVERGEREERRELPGVGEVRFNTRLVYDLDPSFDVPVWRALILITISGKALPPRTLVVPYYPLPADYLSKAMEEAGFRATKYPAFEGLNVNWKYDFVVGKKAG